MPHSSGGGSHGGGSHGGSHHSSRGGSGSSSHVRSTYFPGSRRYFYYRNRRPVYVYADYDITKKPSKARYLFLLCYLPILIAILANCGEAITRPHKLTGYHDTRIIIEDGANVLSDESRLQSQLEAFYEKTGITPAIMTVNNEDWDEYANLTYYAYDLYVNTFDDEKHWLIVYSEPADPDPVFVDWYFEGMQGDDTDEILSEEIGDAFTLSCQKYLTANSKYSVEEALTKSFVDIMPQLMKTRVDYETITSTIILSVGIMFYLYLVLIRRGKQQKLYEQAKPCAAETVREDTCEYCGGVYVVGTCLECPHCSAPIRPHEYSVNQEK